MVNELVTRMTVITAERPCQVMNSVPSGGNTGSVARTLK
jgi:hypothetical protein